MYFNLSKNYFKLSSETKKEIENQIKSIKGIPVIEASVWKHIKPLYTYIIYKFIITNYIYIYIKFILIKSIK